MISFSIHDFIHLQSVTSSLKFYKFSSRQIIIEFKISGGFWSIWVSLKLRETDVIVSWNLFLLFCLRIISKQKTKELCYFKYLQRYCNFFYLFSGDFTWGKSFVSCAVFHFIQDTRRKQNYWEWRTKCKKVSTTNIFFNGFLSSERKMLMAF